MITTCKVLKIESCQDLGGEVKRRCLRYKGIHENEEGQSRKTKWNLCSSICVWLQAVSHTWAILMEEFYEEYRRHFRLNEEERTDRLRWYQARYYKLWKYEWLWVSCHMCQFCYQWKRVPCPAPVTHIKKEKQTPDMMVDDIENDLYPCKPYLCTSYTGRNDKCYD